MKIFSSHRSHRSNKIDRPESKSFARRSNSFKRYKPLCHVVAQSPVARSVCRLHYSTTLSGCMRNGTAARNLTRFFAEAFEIIQLASSSSVSTSRHSYGV